MVCAGYACATRRLHRITAAATGRHDTAVRASAALSVCSIYIVSADRRTFHTRSHSTSYRARVYLTRKTRLRHFVSFVVFPTHFPDDDDEDDDGEDDGDNEDDDITTFAAKTICRNSWWSFSVRTYPSPPPLPSSRFLYFLPVFVKYGFTGCPEVNNPRERFTTDGRNLDDSADDGDRRPGVGCDAAIVGRGCRTHLSVIHSHRSAARYPAVANRQPLTHPRTPALVSVVTAGYVRRTYLAKNNPPYTRPRPLDRRVDATAATTTTATAVTTTTRTTTVIVVLRLLHYAGAIGTVRDAIGHSPMSCCWPPVACVTTPPLT